MSEILTAAKVAEMKARADGATAGPWEEDGRDGPILGDLQCIVAAHSIDYVPDAVFIVHARTDVPELADSHEALRALLLKDRIADALAWAMNAAENAQHAAEYREVWDAVQELRSAVQP